MLAVFASYYSKPTNLENHYQPNCFNSDTGIVDSFGLALSKKLRLSSSLTMHRRNNRIILRHQKPNENLFHENFAHLMLMLYHSFFNENDFKVNDSYLSNT